MRAVLPRLALVVALLMGTGAHWVMLQAGAWAAMKVRGQSDPCAVCLAVDRGLSQDQPKPAANPPKVDFALPAAAVVSAAVPAAPEPSALPAPRGAGPAAPLLPPPRALSA